MQSKRILSLLFLFITLLSLCSCASDTAADGDYVPVKDESGTVTGYERKYHNDNGDITRWDVYDAQEQYDHYILYEYDSENRPVKETYYQASGIGEYYYAYSYDENGELAEKDYCTAKEGSERILYENGAESKRLTFDSNDELTKYEEYHNGSWIEAEPPTEATEATE